MRKHVILIAGGLYVITASLFAADSLLPNGGFEEGEKGHPQGWKSSIGSEKNRPDYYIVGGVEGETVFKGTRAVLLPVLADKFSKDRKLRNSWESDVSVTDTTPFVPLEPGKSYRLTFMIKREGFNDPRQYVIAQCRGWTVPKESDDKVLGSSGNLTDNCGWEKQTIEFAVPADGGINALQVNFRLFYPEGIPAELATGRAYIDEVELARID